jgi:hypothetical protein
MLKPWSIDGKSGDIQYPHGEVVYQTRGVVVQPIYVTGTGNRADDYYIEEDGKLLPAPMNCFNGYCYRQDGL